VFPAVVGKLEASPVECGELRVPRWLRGIRDDDFVVVGDREPAVVERPVVEFTQRDAVPDVVRAAIGSGLQVGRLDLSTSMRGLSLDANNCTPLVVSLAKAWRKVSFVQSARLF